MTINEAYKLLTPLQGKGSTNILMQYSVGTVKEAIRTIFRAKSATQDMMAIASSVEDVILRYQYRGKS